VSGLYRHARFRHRRRLVFELRVADHRGCSERVDDHERVDVYFNHKLSPGGYSYLFILDGLATFGCAIVADFKKIDEYFDHSLAAAKRIHAFQVPETTRTGYSYMNFHLKTQATNGNARYVGEAAG
jgi:flavin-dependent dehydrogenase